MTGPEFSQPLPIPEFVQAFTGTQPEVSEKSRQIIAERFTDFVREVLLNNIENVVSRQSIQGEIPRSQVELVRPDRSGVWVIKVMEQAYSAYSEIDEELRMPRAAIDLEFADSNRNERHGYQYRLLDGAVRRLDFDDLASDPGEGQYESVFDEDAARTARRYDQPITIAELEGLKTFVMSAQPERPMFRG